MSATDKQHLFSFLAIVLLLGNLVMNAKCAMSIRDVSAELRIFREQQSKVDMESIEKLKAMESWVDAHTTRAYKIESVQK